MTNEEKAMHPGCEDIFFNLQAAWKETQNDNNRTQVYIQETVFFSFLRV